MLRIGKERGAAAVEPGRSAAEPDRAGRCAAWSWRLEVGQPSQPILQSNGIGVIMVCGKKPMPSRRRRPATSVADSLMRESARHAGAALSARSAPRRLCRRSGVKHGAAARLDDGRARRHRRRNRAARRGCGAAEGVPPFYLIDDPERLAATGGAARLAGAGAADRRPRRERRCLRRPRCRWCRSAPRCAPAPGQPDPADAAAVIGAIDAAVADVRGGRAAALVTNPINKDSALSRRVSPSRPHRIPRRAGRRRADRR